MGVLRIILSVILLAGAGYLAFNLYAGSQGPAETRQQLATAPDETETIETLERTWRRWVAARGATKATFVVGRRGEILHTAGIGISADDPLPIGNLSNAITGICLAHLFDTQALSFDMKLAALKDSFLDLRAPLPLWAQDITITQLMTHTSGLNPDVTQDGVWNNLRSDEPRHVRIALAALAQSAITGNRGQFFFNNGNYAVLAVVIEAISGLPYEAACQTGVLDPAGVTTASLSGPFTAYSAFAGWTISSSDYLRFAMHWTMPDQTWIAYPASYPKASMGGIETYALGLVRTPHGDGVALDAIGRWCSENPARPNVGSGVIVVPGGWAIMVTWNRCTPADEAYAFLQEMIAATR